MLLRITTKYKLQNINKNVDEIKHNTYTKNILKGRCYENSVSEKHMGGCLGLERDCPTKTNRGLEWYQSTAYDFAWYFF
jgi:hypothetical protein